MAIQTINLGTFANDGTGDDLRTAFEKVNANFTALDTISVSGAVNLGSGVPLFSTKVPSPEIGEDLAFRSLTNGNNILLSYNGTSITVSSTTTFTGQVSDISNHELEDLGNVSSATPLIGQILVWQGGQWGPETSPSQTFLDFAFPGFDGSFTNPIEFLLGQTDLDFGPFIVTSFDTELELNLGTF